MSYVYLTLILYYVTCKFNLDIILCDYTSYFGKADSKR